MEAPNSNNPINSYLYGHFNANEDGFIVAGLSDIESIPIKKIDIKITSFAKFFEYIGNLLEAFYKTKINRSCVVLKVSTSEDVKNTER